MIFSLLGQNPLWRESPRFAPSFQPSRMGRTPCLACRLVTRVGQPANWPTPQVPRGAAGRAAVRGASEVSPSLWKRAEAAWSRCGGGLADWPRVHVPRGPGCCGKRGEHQRQEMGRDGMADGTNARRSQISLLNQSAGENKWRGVWV